MPHEKELILVDLQDYKDQGTQYEYRPTCQYNQQNFSKWFLFENIKDIVIYSHSWIPITRTFVIKHASNERTFVIKQAWAIRACGVSDRVLVDLQCISHTLLSPLSSDSPQTVSCGFACRKTSLTASPPVTPRTRAETYSGGARYYNDLVVKTFV